MTSVMTLVAIVFFMKEGFLIADSIYLLTMEI